MLPLSCCFFIACLILQTQFVVGARKNCPKKLYGAKHVRQAAIENGLPCQLDSDCIGGKCYPKWSETSHQHVNSCCASMPGEKNGIGAISCCGNNMSCLSDQTQPCHCVHAHGTPQDKDLCKSRENCSNWGCDIRRDETRRCCSGMVKDQFCDDVYVHCCGRMYCGRGICRENPPRKHHQPTCRCNGTRPDRSACTKGTCKGDFCRARAFCNGQQTANGQCSTPIVYIYDCVNVQRKQMELKKDTYDRERVVKGCSTQFWWNSSKECCFNTDMCNEHVEPRIGLKESNRIFYNDWIFAPDGYPCDTPSDCQHGRNGHTAWCQERWSADIYESSRPTHIRVCCSAQLGLNSAPCSEQNSCCGSSMKCNQERKRCLYHTSAHDFYGVNTLRVTSVGKLDGDQCSTHEECATKYCRTQYNHTEQKPNKVCCYGTYLGSYCNEAVGLRCCQDSLPVYCEANVCTPHGPGRLCNTIHTAAGSDCHDSICKEKQLTTRNGVKVDVKVCCSGYQLEQQSCQSCALSRWNYREPCDTCCVGYCDGGVCKLRRPDGAACSADNDCISLRCRSSLCCSISNNWYGGYLPGYYFSTTTEGCQSNANCCKYSAGDLYYDRAIVKTKYGGGPACCVSHVAAARARGEIVLPGRTATFCKQWSNFADRSEVPC